MKFVFSVVLITISIAYPAIVYFGIQHFSPAFFSLVLLGVALLKFFTANDRFDIAQMGMLLVVGIYSLGLLITNSAYGLRLYPAVISTCVAVLFGLSLAQPESLIERMARLSGKTITPRAKHYTKTLTLIWAILLIVNAGVALYLAHFASFKLWALYCGLISYGIFGFIFAIEFGYRRYYIAKHGP
jgi:uncharacterized membrane protein